MVKPAVRNIIIAFVVVFITSEVLHLTLIKDPSMNWLCLFFAVLILIAQNKIGKVEGMIVLFSSIFAAVIMLGLKNISGAVFLASLFIYVIAFFVHDFLEPYAKKVEAAETIIGKRKRELSSIKRACEDVELLHDDVDREMKNITHLYGALKEMNKLTIDDIAESITETIKKIIRNSFRIPLEDIHFVVLLKKEADFYIARSFGYDEEMLKKGQAEFINKILKHVNDKQDLLYVKNANEHETFKKSFELSKSILYLPFFVADKLHGVVFISSIKESIFNEKQTESIRILASQAAISLEKVYLYEEIAQMSITDSLTGLYVHRHFQEKLENEIQRSARSGKELSVIMSDIDFFKKVNDTYGHLAGDYILRSIALILKNNTAPADTVARYGGEEFIIALPETDKEKACVKAEKIRKAVENSNFEFKDIKIKITMSLGVASFPADAMTRKALIGQADRALYKAKQGGRNRVEKTELG